MVSLLVLTFVFVVATAVFTLFDIRMQTQNMEDSLAEEARTFAREMDAVWEFMDNSQHTINNTTTGVYEFKGLHCAIVGKSVGAIFSAGNNYSIRYTNFEPRRAQDKPDAFETEALALFNEQKDTQEFFRIVSDDPAEVDRAQTSADNGAAQFRYVQALRVNESCLGVPWRTGRGDRCHRLSQGGLDAGLRRAAPSASSFRWSSSIRPCGKTLSATWASSCFWPRFIGIGGVRAHDRVRAAAA